MTDGLQAYEHEDFHSSDDKKEMEALPNKRKKILVIDDDQDFRLAVCELLVDHGYQVATAKDGEVALNQLVHNPDRPDLILVDIMMPVKDGLAFRREQLMLESSVSGIPVMFLTGQGWVEGESCVMKPFDPTEFLQAIKRHLH